VKFVSADLVLLEGNVLTMNPNQPSAQAVAVRGNKIVHVGANESVSELIGKGTKVLRLEGKTVVPGFIDTHVHVTDYGRLLTWLNLENASSIKEIQRLLSECVGQTGAGKWILGRGWDENRITENRAPTRFDLDAVSPQNPVVLYHQSGQVCVVNSKALEVAGIGMQADVGIEKNPETGEPTGVLKDDATNLVWNKIPQPTPDELYDSTFMALEKIVQAGITSIHWVVLSEAELPVIRKLAEQDALPLRVYLIAPANLLDAALSALKNLNNRFLKLGGAVIFADGYLASRTAALTEPYSDASEEQGKLLCSGKEMRVLAEKIRLAGLQLIIHAVGDRAVAEALSVIEAAGSGFVRPRLEQAAVLNQQLVQRIKRAEVIVSVQPCVVASEFSVWSAASRLGEERVKWLFPTRVLGESGVVVAAGSDAPMEPLNPMLGVDAAVKREASQKITVTDALSMYTRAAAYVSGEEAVKGSIEVGKLADLAVLSINPVSVSSEKLGQISVCLTVLEGRIVCSKS
jgi:predicted amidohydrolase YtcJ